MSQHTIKCVRTNSVVSNGAAPVNACGAQVPAPDAPFVEPSPPAGLASVSETPDGANRPSIYQGTLSLLDQGLVSATNFFTAVLLGRESATELGLYHLGFSVALFAVCVQGSLLSTPYTALQGPLESRARARYAGSILVHQITFAIAIAALFGLFGSLIPSQWIAGGFRELAWILGGILPLVLLRELIRRIAFAHLQVSKVLAMDAAATLVQLGGLGVLSFTGQLSVNSAFLVVGVACGLAGGITAIGMRREFRPTKLDVLPDLGRNWHFGKWVFAAQLTYLGMGYVIPWLVMAQSGADATGRFAACFNLTMIANPLLLGLSNFFFPKAIHAYSSQGIAGLKQFCSRVVRLTTLAVGLLAVALIAFAGPLLRIVYGDALESDAWVVAILAFNLFFYGLSMGAEIGLLSISKPNAILSANLLGLFAAVVVGIVLIPAIGLVGAAIATLSSQIVTTSVKMYCFSQAETSSIPA